jgi:hypothetical protein
MVKVNMKSPLDGKMNRLVLGMEQKEFRARLIRWNNGELIQNAFDNLSADEREFLMSGLVPQNWDALWSIEE